MARTTGKSRARLLAPAVASEGAPLLGVALHRMDLLIRFRPRIIRGKQPRLAYWFGRTPPATLGDTCKSFEWVPDQSEALYRSY